MKIALVIERMDLSRGGRETSTAQIAAALNRRGHEVTILCQSGSWVCKGVEIHALGRRGAGRTRALKNFVADVRVAIDAGDWDVVQAMLPVPGADIYQPRGGTIPAQREAAMRRRGPLGRFFVWLLEPLNFHRQAMGALERRLIVDESVLNLAVSFMVSQEFEEYYGLTERVRVVYNAVDMPDPGCPERPQWRRLRREKLGVGDNAVVFLIVATNLALKGVAEAIAAFAQWRNGPDQPQGRLVVVGSESIEGYQRIAGMLGVGSDVVFIERTEEIHQWYAAADACVLLSWYDPCSRVVLEATCWGIPSITTIFNGAAEVVAGAGGIVVSSPRDSRAIVAGMRELADGQRRFDRSRACEKAAEQLGMDRHVDELLAAYDDVIRMREAK